MIGSELYLHKKTKAGVTCASCQVLIKYSSTYCRKCVPKRPPTKLMSKVCVRCSQTFSGYEYRRYCSHSCALVSNLESNEHFREGRVFSDAHKANLKRGPEHHAWKGGITPVQRQVYRSRQYREWRTAVFVRDDYTCRFCHKKGGTLNADHIQPFSLFPELRFDINNGRTLCVPCHRATPTFGINIHNHTRKLDTVQKKGGTGLPPRS